MIVITCPGFSRHGGIRVLMEWANRLGAVILNTGKGTPDWFDLKAKVYTDPAIINDCQTLIIGSPHAIDLQEMEGSHKTFIFLQMIEHLFKPTDKVWFDKCKRFYTSPHPMILGAHWNNDAVKQMGRTAPTYYVGNGVNLDHFPICTKPKQDRYVLLESPMSTNPVKDTDGVALRVAAKLKQKHGVRVIGYGANDVKAMMFSKYATRPDLATMNELYSTASILIKATKYDARALAPMEAMTKMCVTARGIINGDDDLIHNVTALRCGYDHRELYEISERLLLDSQLRESLSENCLNYVQKFTYDYYIPQIKNILNGSRDNMLV